MSLISQGTTVTWGTATVSYVVRATFSSSDSGKNEISAAHLGTDKCAEEPYEETWGVASDQDTGKSVQLEFITHSVPFSIGQTAALAAGNTAASVSFAICTCLSVTTSGQVGDLKRGSATFRCK